MENGIGEPSAKTETSAASDETAATFHVEKRRLRGTFSQLLNLVYFPFDVQVSPWKYMFIAYVMRCVRK
jgi:hypothetical protein